MTLEGFCFFQLLLESHISKEYTDEAAYPLLTTNFVASSPILVRQAYIDHQTG